jgi:hypothetical protein
MGSQFKGLPSWIDGIDFKSTYAKGVTPEHVIFVDVGGGNGQESEKLRTMVPDLTGRVINQDLSGPLDRAPNLDGVEKMIYDYTGEQTVKGVYSTTCLSVKPSSVCTGLLR